jgi:putative ABC transport system ATP-binding protein
MLRTENLIYAYPGGRDIAFPDVDLPQGGALLLQGVSGSGKSTLLALACGLLAPTHGEISVAGQDLRALLGSERDAWRGRHVGFLPQRLHLSESVSVRGNLALVFFAAGLREEPAKIDGALQALGVLDLAERRPSALSGGQAQRVALARAVLLSPSIILADEPTASLDDEAAAAAIALLLQAAERCGATLIVATHDRRVKQALDGAGQTVQALALQNLSQIDAQPSQNMCSVL